MHFGELVSFPFCAAFFEGADEKLLAGLVAAPLLAGVAGMAVFVLLNLWLDSRENQKAYYATSADAERDKIAGADVFDRGWLPVVLKSGVSEIREEHNVSTNQGRAKAVSGGKLVVDNPEKRRIRGREVAASAHANESLLGRYRRTGSPEDGRRVVAANESGPRNNRLRDSVRGLRQLNIQRLLSRMRKYE